MELIRFENTYEEVEKLRGASCVGGRCSRTVGNFLRQSMSVEVANAGCSGSQPADFFMGATQATSFSRYDPTQQDACTRSKSRPAHAVTCGCQLALDHDLRVSAQARCFRVLR